MRQELSLIMTLNANADANETLRHWCQQRNVTVLDNDDGTVYVRPLDACLTIGGGLNSNGRL